MKQEPIRILQILPGGHVCGGIENFVMNYYRNIDRTKIQFDFLVHYNEKGYYDDEIKKLGGKIYYTNVRKDKKIFKYIGFLSDFFKEHKEYKIIHGHMPGFAPIYFSVAKHNGIKYRISHSHVTDTERTKKGRILKFIIKNIKHFSNIYFACSQLAGEFMYEKKKFTIIHNAVDFNKFSFKKEVRDNLRKELNVENNFVIGCVGRFNQQKNHNFLIEIFSEILKINKDAKLLLIGEGELEKEIKKKAKKMNLIDKILFLGTKQDVYNYYNVFDAFVLPSNFEGLCIALVEAQVNGLPVYTSTNVSTETNISELVNFISLNCSAKEWSEIICNKKNRTNKIAEIENNGYNLVKEVKKLEDLYFSMYNDNWSEKDERDD